MAEPEYTTQELQSEEWRDVPEYPGYSVSNLGRVRSGPTYILSTDPSKDYPRVGLYKNRKQKHFSLHILVAAVFLGPCPDGHIVHHKDHDKRNPRLSNLAYETLSSNTQLAIQAGRGCAGDNHWTRKHPERVLRGKDNPAHWRPETRPRGADHGRAIISEAEAKIILQRRAAGDSYGKLERAFPQLSRSTIVAICKRRIWQHLNSG